MLTAIPLVRIFVCREATDMRCGRHRLAARVREIIGQDPLSGHLFLFFNKRRTSVKVLYFDKSGYAVWHKVLERGTFGLLPRLELDRAELACVLDGIELHTTSRRKHYILPKKGVILDS